VPAVLGPELAGEFGWMTKEFGRQPWLVYGLIRTSAGVSYLAHARDIWAYTGLFGVVYALLFILSVFLVNQKILEGPGGEISSGARRRASA